MNATKQKTSVRCVIKYNDEYYSADDTEMRVDALAQAMEQAGVRPGVCVAICIDRSPEAIVTLLAVKQTGAAYLPLDPSHPVSRLQFMLDDSEAALLITHSRIKAGLDYSGGLVWLYDEPESWGGTLREDPIVVPNNVGYIIYTSGSTGKPKGVMCSWSSVDIMLDDLQKRRPLMPGDVCMQWANLCFDVSVFDIFEAVYYTGVLDIQPEDLKGDGPGMMKWLYEHQIAAGYVPPMMVADLVDWCRANTGKCTLKRLILAVEPIPLAFMREIQALSPDISIINGYGPTETTIFSTFYNVWEDDSEDYPGRRAPIGMPVQGSVHYLVDDKMNLVPQGEIGELLIGGSCVSQGYIKRPELTAERYIKDTYSDDPNIRLYRSGDLVKQLADGNYEFVGRADNQFKLNEVRIEAGEIAAVISEHPSVREVVVMPVEIDGVKRIAAYLRLTAGADTAKVKRECYELCSRVLMRVMWPTYFVIQQHMPITAHGRELRKALPIPTLNDMVEQDITPARDDFDAKLLHEFSKLLAPAEIGIDHNFFMTGGNSLMAASLAHRLSTEFSMDVKLVHVVKNPTVRQLADALCLVESQNGLPGIQIVDDQQKGPLSHSQQREWYVCQVSPDDPVYNIVCAYNLHGEFHTDAMQRAIDEIVLAQPSLRTQFRLVNGQLLQEVIPALRVVVNELQADNYTSAKEMADALAAVPFNLRKAPLLRVNVIRYGADDCMVVVVINHIISDGWSMDLFIEDVNRLYNDRTAKPTVPQRSYIDYSHWQQLPDTQKIWQQQREYWAKQLVAAPSLLPLPTDRPRPAVADDHAHMAKLHIPLALAQRLNELANDRKVTVFNVLLGAMYFVLHRLSGERDICVGMFHANRERVEIEQTMGIFINSVVLRTQILPSDTFNDLVLRVCDVVNEALDNGGVPFEQVMDAANVERSRAYSPIFQVMFQYQNMEINSLQLDGIESQPEWISADRSVFDLTWWVTPNKNGIDVVLDYRTDLFDDSTAERWLQMWSYALEMLANQPGALLDALPCHTDDEEAQLLNFGKPIDDGVEIDPRPVPELIMEQLAEHPYSPAIKWWDDTTQKSLEWSCADLSSYAQRVAASLQGQDHSVGVCLTRRPELIGCLLGVMLAGCTVIALDSTYPEERLHHIMSDSGMGCVLCNGETIELVRRLGVDAVAVDIDTLQPAQHQVGCRADRDSTAVIIYTSGSTGTPRGVEISHCSLSNFAQRAMLGYGFTSDDVVLQFSSPSFDASMEEIYPCLLAGGVLVLRTPDTANDAMELNRLIRAWGVTILDLPTAYFSVAVASLAAPELPSTVRMVIIGGEKALSHHVASFIERYPRIKLMNTYGPTECTVVCSMAELSSHLMDEHDGEAPIGRPCFGAVARVVDDAGQLTPLGAVGELWIGGDGVAIGYRNRPEMTEQRFVSDASGQRFYLTGDLVRWRSNGNLEYVGRSDRQVKLHGYRVEPAEIEEACCRIIGVKQAVVIAVGDAANKQLAAYLAAEPGLEDHVVREYLEQSLPSYMVPAAIMLMPELPMTPGGKLDANALPEVNVSRVEQEYTAPRTPVEEVLCEVWGHMFNRKVGINDDFFDLGGFSLMIMEMIVLTSHYGLTLTPAQVIRCSTIRKLAEALEEVQHEGIVVKLADSDNELAPLFIVHSTPGDVMGYAHLASLIGAQRAVYGLESLGLSDPEHAHSSVEQMATAYIEAMKSVQPEGPYHIAGWCYGGMVASEMAIQLHDAGEQTGSVFLIETPTSSLDGTQMIAFVRRSCALLSLGPIGIYRWLQGKRRYQQRLKSGEMERGFRLDIDSGVLKNRAMVSKLNLEASEKYRQSRHPGDIHVISGDAIADDAIPESDWGWKSKTAKVTFDVIPGTHETVLKQPNVRKLAEVILRYLPKHDVVNG